MRSESQYTDKRRGSVWSCQNYSMWLLTPIGHLGDISRRGVEVLNQVAVVAAEDTRRTRVLLQHWPIEL